METKQKINSFFLSQKLFSWMIKPQRNKDHVYSYANGYISGYAHNYVLCGYANSYTQGNAHGYVYGYAYDYTPRLCPQTTFMVACLAKR
jgi:hypothetical protein